MRQNARQQGFLRLPNKEHVAVFSPKRVENALETAGHSETRRTSPAFSRKWPENPLELAQALCALANFGEAAAGKQGEVYPRLREALLYLARAGWDRDAGWRDFAQLNPHVATAIRERVGEATSAVYLMGESERKWETEPGRLALAWECHELAIALGAVIDGCVAGGVFPLSYKEFVRCNPEGHLEPAPMTLLGSLQDIFFRVRTHPKIDQRRFARCERCKAFHYKRRQTSRACSDRCEESLRASRHYYRDKERRARALELHHRGKSTFQIGRILGVRLSQVRRYLQKNKG